MATEASLISQGNGQMSLAKAHTANKDDIASACDEVEPEDVLHLQPIDAFGPAPFELFDGFDLWQTCMPDAPLSSTVPAQVDLGSGQFG